MPNTTAILVFAQPVAFDAARKRFANLPLPNRRVLEQLNERVQQTAAATNLPVLHSAELIAHTGTFGEQLTAALRAAFEHGFERVLVVGNDCPALTTDHLTQAAHQLQSAEVVLGPDGRGGLYLFGLSRAVFERLSLAALPWQTGRLARAVSRACGGWSVAVLPSLGDANSRDDLRHYRISSATVASFIEHLLQLGAVRKTTPANAQSLRLDRVGVGVGLLRGPPAFNVAVIVA